MKVERTAIPGVLIVEPAVFGDERGFFLESYNEREMRKIGIDAHFVQDNHSRSTRNVLRGLHYQMIQPQGKLVRVVSGNGRALGGEQADLLAAAGNGSWLCCALRLGRFSL
jgi:dTDP-4-dehydrorhamnose 3,5-epimerase